MSTDELEILFMSFHMLRSGYSYTTFHRWPCRRCK